MYRRLALRRIRKANRRNEKTVRLGGTSRRYLAEIRKLGWEQTDQVTFNNLPIFRKVDAGAPC